MISYIVAYIHKTVFVTLCHFSSSVHLECVSGIKTHEFNGRHRDSGKHTRMPQN